MQTEILLAAIVFIVTYVLISVRRFKRFAIERYVAALLGAALMIVLGVVTPQDALAAVDLSIIALLLGMMLLVASLEVCGFFTWVSVKIITTAKNQFQFLILVMVSTAVLSALILNDTVVLLFTPIIIRSCRLIRADPIPFMVAEAISANIGSVATEVGNPQNAYIATVSGIPFAEFSLRLIPVTVASMLIAIVIVWFVFRNDLRETALESHRAEAVAKRWRVLRNQVSKAIDCEEGKDCAGVEKMNRSVFVVLAVLVLVFIGFVLSPQTGLPLALVAFAGGAFVLVLLPLANRKVGAKNILTGVDWTLLLFFGGLFVVLKGVETSGLMNDMVQAFVSLGGGGLGSIGGLSAFTAILSNLISNVPAVLLLSPFVTALGGTVLWLALAASSTLAGNATILGAAANVIVVESGNKMGVEVSLWKFMKAGLPITIVTLVVSVFLLEVLA
jgi:Na+/H+ antiporter NhaD/arsenite permease-like protein